MKRLFVAIKFDPGKEFLKQLRELRSQFVCERIKWVEEHNIHITLKFFGETEEERIPVINRVLEEIAADTDVFSFSLQKLGIFGSSYNPRVVWVGIEPFAELAFIMKIISDKFTVIGYEPDRQNLVPHLTLGRIKFLKDKKLFQQTIDQKKEITSEVIMVDRFILFESILKKEGPVYLALKTFQLMK
jgi:2'-5' RNA ligase